MSEAAGVYEQRWRSRGSPTTSQYYLDDGLLSFSYGPYYPLVIGAAPELGVVARDAPAVRAWTSWSRSGPTGRWSSWAAKPGASWAREPVSRAAPSLAPRCDRGVARGGRWPRHQLGRHPTDRLISVLLPVKDGAAFLRELLPRLLGQSLPDSAGDHRRRLGLQDDSIDVLVAHGATVLAIAPADFDHGLTRNLAAEHASRRHPDFPQPARMPDR